MTAFSISVLINGVMFFILAAFVYFSNPKALINKVAGANNLVVGVWYLIVFFIVTYIKDKHSALVLAQAAHILSLFGAYTFYYTSVTVLRLNEEKKKISGVFFLLVLWISLAITLFGNLFVKDMAPRYDLQFFPVPGTLYSIHTSALIAMIYYNLHLMVKAYKTFSGYRKNQIKYLFLGTFFAALGTFNNAIYNIYPFGNNFVILYGVCLVYAISRYRLMDVTLIFNKTILLAVSLGVFLGSFVFVNWLFLIKFKMPYSLANALSVSIIATVVILLRGRLISLADFLIYRGRYAYQKVLIEASKAMVSILDLDELLGYIVKTIAENLSPLKACILIEDRQAPTPVYSIKAAYGVENELMVNYSLSDQKGIIPYLKEKKTTLIKEEMLRIIPVKEFEYIYQNLDKIEAEVILPLFYKGHLRGLLTLANKVSGIIYDRSDLRILEFLAETAAVAIANAQLFVEAITDGLTGLYHYKFFQQELIREIERSKRYQQSLSLLIMDIDYFKNFNDAYGHQTGDIILKELAKLLKANTRRADIPARYGGEEFAYILVETDLETALFVAKRINQKVKEVNFLQEVQKEGISLKQLPEGGKLTVTVSIGAASFDGKDLNMTAEQLIHKADMALYRAKEEGRDRICL